MPARPAPTTSIDTSPAIGYLEAIAAQQVAPEPVYHRTSTAARVSKASQTLTAARVRKVSEPSPIRNTPLYRVTKSTLPPHERVVKQSSSSYINEPPLRRHRTECKPVEWGMITPHETVRPHYRELARLIMIHGRIMFALSLVVAW